MADNLRESTTSGQVKVTEEEKVLGNKAVGGVDNDEDHVPNVESGLKAAISNPNTSEKAKKEAKAKLDAI